MKRAVLSLSLLLLGARCVPVVTDSTPATLVGGVVRIEGHNFGVPGAKSAVVLADGLQIPSFEATLWRDDAIEVALPEEARSGTVSVVTRRGSSVPVPLDIYRYDWFAIPETRGTNAFPLSLALDGEGRVWVNEEFHLRRVQHLDPAEGAVTGIKAPASPDPGPFAMSWEDTPTQMSSLGEDVLVDPRGRVWFTEGGAYLYTGAYPNHSRVVCYDPAAEPAQRFRVYNVPGDWNEVIGLAWDEGRGRIWFSQGGLVAGAKLYSFDPDRVPWDNSFDFSTSLDYLVNPPDPDEGYRVYGLPDPLVQPAHLAVDPDGSIWYSAFWGNRIGRLVPETGEVREVPLPGAIGESFATAIVGSGPWGIQVAPDGTVVLGEFFDATLTRVDADRVRAGDPACEALDADGANPCILAEFVVPDLDPVNDQVHSIARDPGGRLWYTLHGPDEPGGRASLGFVTADWSRIVRLPPLPRDPGEPALAASGVAVDPANGDVWFTEFWSKRIGRLRRE